MILTTLNLGTTNVNVKVPICICSDVVIFYSSNKKIRYIIRGKHFICVEPGNPRRN